MEGYLGQCEGQGHRSKVKVNESNKCSEWAFQCIVSLSGDASPCRKTIEEYDGGVRHGVYSKHMQFHY